MIKELIKQAIKQDIIRKLAEGQDVFGDAAKELKKLKKEKKKRKLDEAIRLYFP